MQKILLTIMPIFWPKMPPLGIHYLQAFMSQNGFKADILDLNNIFYNLSSPSIQKEWLVSCNTALEKNISSIMQNDLGEKFYRYLDKILEYDAVGFSCFKSNLDSTIKIARILKSRKPAIKIIFGGPEITRQYFKNNRKLPDNIKSLAMLTVIGEGELPLLEYALKKNNHIKTTAFHELQDLEALPFPKYEGNLLERYPRKNAVSMLFSRGCIRKCSFCSERLLYKKFRARPVENMLKEIYYHKDKNNIKYFVFHDSMINADTEKLERLCEGIIKSFGSINWEAQLYIRDMDMKLLDKIKKSGCYNLFIGLESGSSATLNRMNKGFNPEAASSLFKKLNDAGLYFGISLITGYPGETEKDSRESLDFVISHRHIIPKIEQINPFIYYEGTSVIKNKKQKTNKISMERFNAFTEEIKKHGFKHTNAFLGNLIEK